MAAVSSVWLTGDAGSILFAGLMVHRAQRRVAASLREQAYRDSLTRLPNRRALLERVQSLLTHREGRSHALMIDPAG